MTTSAKILLLLEDLWDEIAKDEEDIAVPLTHKEALA